MEMQPLARGCGPGGSRRCAPRTAAAPSRSRRNACTIRSPDTDSWRSALTRRTRSRASSYAFTLGPAEEARCATTSGGSVAKTTSASWTSITSSATMMPKKVTTRDEGGDQAGLQERRQRVDVRRHPGHDPAGQLALVVVEAEALELGEDLQPQRVEHALAGAAGHPGLADLRGPLRRARRPGRAADGGPDGAERRSGRRPGRCRAGSAPAAAGSCRRRRRPGRG